MLSKKGIVSEACVLITISILRRRTNAGEALRMLIGTSEARGQFENLSSHFGNLSTEFNRILQVSNDIITQHIRRVVDWESRQRLTETVQRWISPLDFVKYQEDVFSRRHEGTGEWFLESEMFANWRDGEGDSGLWCPGIREWTVT
jgi:hypothetical protein